MASLHACAVYAVREILEKARDEHGIEIGFLWSQLDKLTLEAVFEVRDLIFKLNEKSS